AHNSLGHLLGAARDRVAIVAADHHKLPGSSEKEVILHRAATRVECESSAGAIGIQLVSARSPLLPRRRSVQTRRLGDVQHTDGVAVPVHSDAGGETAGSSDKTKGHNVESVHGKGPCTTESRKRIGRTCRCYGLALRAAGRVIAIVSADEIDFVGIHEK